MIRFYEKRFIYFGISFVLILAGIIGLFVNGMDLDITFKGGAVLQYKYENSIDTAKAAEIATQTLGRETSVQLTTDVATQTQKAVFNLAGQQGLASQEQGKLDEALNNAFPDSNLESFSSNIVEPYIGKRFFQNCMWALIIAFLLITFYIWWRFQRISGLSAGVMALVSLIHDAILVFFVFILFKIPINESFIAVTLTIIGYSVNDTIVIYDRIRENRNLDRKMPVVELVNKSITQSFERSINTTATTVISMAIVYVFAVIFNIESIRIFALPMTIGLISGAYSTICIAGPLWAMWQNRKTVKA